jgi:hypothetical protein
MKKNATFGAIFVIAGVLIALTPRYILPTCEYGKASHALSSCSYMGRAEMVLGFIMVGAGIGAFFSKTGAALRAVMFPTLFVSLAVLFLPKVTGYCASPNMPCNYGTVPMLRLIGGISAIVAIMGFVLAREKK